MSRKFGIGIIGVGMAVRPHMLSLQDLAGEIEVCGVYARTRATREAFALETGFPAADSIDALLSNPNLDAILLLTPANARVEIVRSVAAAGKHILMEKPAGRTTQDAEEIVAICDDAGVKLGVVFQNRFRAASLTMKDLLDSGKLGELALAFLVVPWWRGQGYYDERGRGTLERDGGGVMITQAVHSMDLMLSLTGPVAEVAAIVGTTCLHNMETEDFVGAGLKFASGALGSLMATVNCFPGEQEFMVFNCTKGSAKLAGGVLEADYNDTSESEIKSTGYVVDTLQASIWAVENSKSFEGAVLKAVNLGDDADTVGAVTGQIAGAMYGYSEVARHLKTGLVDERKI